MARHRARPAWRPGKGAAGCAPDCAQAEQARRKDAGWSVLKFGACANHFRSYAFVSYGASDNAALMTWYAVDGPRLPNPHC